MPEFAAKTSLSRLPGARDSKTGPGLGPGGPAPPAHAAPILKRKPADVDGAGEQNADADAGRGAMPLPVAQGQASLLRFFAKATPRREHPPACDGAAPGARRRSATRG